MTIHRFSVKTDVKTERPYPSIQLERYAVNLVFSGTVCPDDLTIEVVETEQIGVDGADASYNGNGRITISRASYSDAEDLDVSTTVGSIDKTRPNNIKYLASFVHESGHHWQWVHQRYRNSVPQYTFNDRDLATANFVCKEQHASVGQVYFILKWQWDLGIPKIDLTDESYLVCDNVGPAGRMAYIGMRGHNSNRKRYDPWRGW